MAAELRVAAEAEQDIGDAYTWYEVQRSGLGEDFLGCVEACLEAVRRMPESWPVVHEGFRRALVRRLPDAVFYECENAAVTVYGVFHTSRNPAKWQRRLS